MAVHMVPEGLWATRMTRTIATFLLVMFFVAAAWSVKARTATTTSSQPAAGNAYGKWKNGPSKGADYFPIAVWLQDPANAAKYKAAGFNVYVGLWQGPTEPQLAALKKADMAVVCEQNEVGLKHKDDPVIIGWMPGDEPDNAQEAVDPKTGKKGYGPCVPPQKIVDAYKKAQAADPSRPIMLNLGQGVASDEWKGRGNGAKLGDYETYVKGGDIISFDIYPVAGLPKPDSENYLWMVAKGVDRLGKWTGGQKIIWNCIECTHIGNPTAKASPHQVRGEVWMSLVHGSTGLIYFVHQFKPSFKEAALLADPEMLAAVTRINKQIHGLAPVLNSATISGQATVESSATNVPIDIMVKRLGGSVYLFAVNMRNEKTTGRFAVKGLAADSKADVLEEGRAIDAAGGKFTDDFAPYDVHIYRIR